MFGLLALMDLQASRLAARTGADGALVPLTEQDRSRWDQLSISRGPDALAYAEALGGDGPYVPQAALAACPRTGADGGGDGLAADRGALRSAGGWSSRRRWSISIAPSHTAWHLGRRLGLRCLMRSQAPLPYGTTRRCRQHVGISCSAPVDWRRLAQSSRRQPSSRATSGRRRSCWLARRRVTNR